MDLARGAIEAIDPLDPRPLRIFIPLSHRDFPSGSPEANCLARLCRLGTTHLKAEIQTEVNRDVASRRLWVQQMDACTDNYGLSNMDLVFSTMTEMYLSYPTSNPVLYEANLIKMASAV